MKEFKCLLRVDEEDLNKGNLEIHKKKLWEEFKDDFKATLVIVRSNMKKEFAFFIPNRLNPGNFNFDISN